jgi:hypothetical protein
MLATVVALWGSGRTTHSQSGPSYGITDLGTIGGTASVALTLDDLALPEVYGYGTTRFWRGARTPRPPGFGASDLGTLLADTGVKLARPINTPLSDCRK